MISPQKHIRMARKWQKMAALGRKRILLQRINKNVEENSCTTSSVAYKGHFVVHSSDRRRFVIPLAYLNSEIMTELFHMSEEEYRIQMCMLKSWKAAHPLRTSTKTKPMSNFSYVHPEVN